jgi:hypothetical protein
MRRSTGCKRREHNAFALALCIFLLAAGARAAAPMALWVWERETFRLLDDGQWRRDTLHFLHRRGFDALYLYADSYHGRLPLRDEPQLYRAAISELHASGFRVYALLGSADLETQNYIFPERRDAAMAMVNRVFDYNDAAARGQRFDGINLDVEPYLTTLWDSDPPRVLGLYLDLSDAIMRSKRTHGSTIVVGPAMPFWYDGDVVTWRGHTRPMNEHVQSLYDYVAIMDYRDHADGSDSIISLAASEMAFAAKIGRPVVIGVDTGPGGLQKLSFHHRDEGYMRDELAKVRAHYGESPAFGGFAVHHLGTYLSWCCGK